MKSRVNCIICHKLFWSKTAKNKITKEVVALDNICQGCKNRIRQRGMKRKVRIRLIPKKFNKELTMRELWMKERERRKEDVGRNKLRNQK